MGRGNGFIQYNQLTQIRPRELVQQAPRVVRSSRKMTDQRRTMLFAVLILLYSSVSCLALQPQSRLSCVRRSYSRIVPVRQPADLKRLRMAVDNDMEENEEGYTRKQVIKEEIEAPFRKIRFFIYFSLFAAAGLGTLVTLAMLLGTTTGKQANMTELYTNLAINVGGLPVLALLYKRDVDAQNSLLERIQKGGKLAGLRLKLVNNGAPAVVKLSDLRRDRGIDKRVVIVCAPKLLLRESLESSIKESRNLIGADLLIAPLVIEKEAGGDYTLTATSLEAMVPDTPDVATYEHIGLPLVLATWNSVIKKELEVALKQSPEALDKGVTIIIKKNGKVGSRRFGVPIWEAMVNDVEARVSAGLDVTNI